MPLLLTRVPGRAKAHPLQRILQNDRIVPKAMCTGVGAEAAIQECIGQVLADGRNETFVLIPIQIGRQIQSACWSKSNIMASHQIHFCCRCADIDEISYS